MGRKDRGNSSADDEFRLGSPIGGLSDGIVIRLSRGEVLGRSTDANYYPISGPWLDQVAGRRELIDAVGFEVLTRGHVGAKRLVGAKEILRYLASQGVEIPTERTLRNWRATDPGPVHASATGTLYVTYADLGALVTWATTLSARLHSAERAETRDGHAIEEE